MEVLLDGVRFRRGSRLVLDVPRLNIPSGKVTALLGPNGSGKSTLLHLVAALERPEAGAVLLGGVPASRDRRTREVIAYAFQEPVFLSGSVRSNLDLALRLRRIPGGERTARVADVAGALGIRHLLDRDVRQLSGGESQRASLARALSLRAPLTLLDEPLSGLDGPARLQLLQELPGLLRAFATSVVFVTHDRDEALRLADELVVLIDGRVRAAGPKLAIFRSPPDPGTATVIGFAVIPSEAGLLGIPPGVLSVGRGDVDLEMTVESVVDFGNGVEATGLVGGVRVGARVGGDPPREGATVTVSASQRAVVRWPGTALAAASAVTPIAPN